MRLCAVAVTESRAQHGPSTWEELQPPSGLPFNLVAFTNLFKIPTRPVPKVLMKTLKRTDPKTDL